MDGGINERKKETTKSESDEVGRCVVEKRRKAVGRRERGRGKKVNLYLLERGKSRM